MNPANTAAAGACSEFLILWFRLLSEFARTHRLVGQPWNAGRLLLFENESQCLIQYFARRIAPEFVTVGSMQNSLPSGLSQLPSSVEHRRGGFPIGSRVNSETRLLYRNELKVRVKAEVGCLA